MSTSLFPKKKVLILYTNTTGLHNNNIDAVSKKNLYQYARLIQLSYTINSYNNNKSVNILPTLSHIIKPHTININGSAKFHNISQELADEKGIDIYDVLNEFITINFKILLKLSRSSFSMPSKRMSFHSSSTLNIICEIS